MNDEKVKMYMLKFSIIIPVYNIEKYLEQCVESILAQTWKEYEIILVDDGSTDQSGNLCDNLVQKDIRIKTIHQKNNGASSARNAGIALASGEYIFCVDGDDFIASSFFLEYAAGILKNSKTDFMQIAFSTCSEDGTICYNQIPRWKSEIFDQMTKEQKIKSIIGDKLFIISPWSKFVRRKFLQDNNIVFPEGMCVEDIDWSFQILTKARHIAVMENVDYVYRKRTSSSSKHMSEKQIYDYILLLETWAEYFQNHVDDNRDTLVGYLAYEYYICLGMLRFLKNPQKQRLAYKRMKELKWITKYSINRKTDICKFTSKLLGIHISSMLLGTYIKYKV